MRSRAEIEAELVYNEGDRPISVYQEDILELLLDIRELLGTEIIYVEGHYWPPNAETRTDENPKEVTND